MFADASAPMNRLERLYSPPEIGAPGKREARRRRHDLFYSGLFVLAMAAVAIAALAFLMPGLFGGAYRLQAYFLDAAGLIDGIQVIQEGYVIGIVEGVTPLFPGRDPAAARCPLPAADAAPRSPALPCFRATLRIKDDWPVPTDSVAQLGAAGLLQGDAIKISPGVATTLLADGSRIMAAGREPDLLAKLNGLSEALDDIVQKTIGPALASVKAQIETIQTLLGTGGDQAGNRERLTGAVENLRTLSANLASSIDPRKIAAILDSLQTLSKNLTEVSVKIGGGTEEVKGAAREYGDLARALRVLVSDNKPALQGSLDDTQALLQELTAGQSPILVNIEEATRNLSALARDLRRDPAVIIKGRKVEEQAPWFK